MGDNIKNSKEWLTAQKLTPIQLFYIIIVTFYFIFTQTSLYDFFPDFLQTIIFVIVVVVGVLLGVSFLNVKKIALEMKAIYNDKTLTPEQKVNKYGELALIILTKLGQAFDILNAQQGINTYKKPEEKKIEEPTEPLKPEVLPLN